MRISQGIKWSVETLGWATDQDETCITLNPPNGGAALQISAATKRSGAVSDDDLLRTLAEYSPAEEQARQVECGDFVGYHADAVFTDDDGTSTPFWIWSLRHENTKLLVTLFCDKEAEERYRKDVQTIVESLKAGPA